MHPTGHPDDERERAFSFGLTTMPPDMAPWEARARADRARADMAIAADALDWRGLSTALARLQEVESGDEAQPSGRGWRLILTLLRRRRARSAPPSPSRRFRHRPPGAPDGRAAPHTDMEVETMGTTPIDVQRHLEGAIYPCSADDLAATAESNGAPEELVERLRGMGGDLSGPDDVMRRMST